MISIGSALNSVDSNANSDNFITDSNVQLAGHFKVKAR